MNTQLRHAVEWVRSQSTPHLVAASFVIGLSLGALLGTADVKRLVREVIEPTGEQIGSAVQPPSEKAEPTKLHRQLDGKLVDATDARQFPYCVMIENAAFDGVRPQSGLSEAAIVYEVIVEGGITRFLAVYGEDRPDRIGPVRSARDNFVTYAAEYNCPYYHAGGSDTALQRIRDVSLRDVDGLIEYQYFWRDPLKFGPHDLFTSGKLLKKAAREHNWLNEAYPDFISWSRVDENAAKSYTVSADTRPAQVVRIGYDPGYEAEWTYNANTRQYVRKTAGVKHIDENTGQALTAKNVIVLHVGNGMPIPGKGRINWPVVGSGKADIVYEGRVYSAFWRKGSDRSRTLFVDSNGDMLPIAVGNSWIQVVPPHVQVTIE